MQSLDTKILNQFSEIFRTFEYRKSEQLYAPTFTRWKSCLKEALYKAYTKLLYRE